MVRFYKVFSRLLLCLLVSAEAFGAHSKMSEMAAMKVLLRELEKRSSGNPKPCEGRLTLTSGTAVTTADVTGATTVYFTPYGGNKVSIFNGDSWDLFAFNELSVAVPATTSTPFDIFIYNNSGSAALTTTNWTNDTTRATEIVFQDGIYVKSGSRQYRYLGTGRTTTVSGQTEDSVSKRFIWNYYNRKPRPLRVEESTASWSYATTVTWQEANASTSNRVGIVVGVKETLVKLMAHGVVNMGVGEVDQCIGDKTTTSRGTDCIGGYAYGLSTKTGLASSFLAYPDKGYNYYSWIEVSSSGHAHTFYGGPGADDSRRVGMTGSFDG